jgi:nuclear transport factor 2 (NTF2) superfamily protein
MATQTTTRPPLPPFTSETAIQKVRLAEDGWNTRDPAKVALAYAIDSRWRNRSEFINGQSEIIAFLSRKWAKELDYRLIKEMWAFTGNRIAVRFAYEWHDDSGHWYRSYGNENWEFNDDGLFMSIDLATARHAQTLLATHFNGQPLTVEHGAPLRLLVPVKLGLKNVKAVTRITYAAKEPRDYWAERGYSRYDGV